METEVGHKDETSNSSTTNPPSAQMDEQQQQQGGNSDHSDAVASSTTGGDVDVEASSSSSAAAAGEASGAASSSSSADGSASDASERRSRSNSAKGRAWKVKGGEGGSPSATPAADHPAASQPAGASSDATLAAAASVLASPPTSSSSPQTRQHQQQQQQQQAGARGRGRRGSTKEGLSPSPPGSPHVGERPRGPDDGSSILGHRLQSPWTFWFSRKDRRRSNSITAGAGGTVVIDKKQDKKEHMDNLVQIGTCRTVEEFWHHYVYIQRASSLPKESNLYFFRNQLKPMWETFPKGGCFIIKVDKRTGSVDKMWEELLFAAIGEVFEDPNVVGVEVSIRSKEDGLSVWTRTNHPQLRQSIGEKLKLLLSLDDVMYKSNATSIKDRSTYKNAQKIIVAS